MFDVICMHIYVTDVEAVQRVEVEDFPVFFEVDKGNDFFSKSGKQNKQHGTRT